MLEIRHLRTLRAIDETGSLAAAARVICVTQSALSHQLKQLEAHYETTLFTRDTRPMALTESGRKLLDLANDVLPRIDETESRLKVPTLHATRFHVAIECHSCFDWLLPALNHVRKHWPDLDVDALMSFNALPDLARQKVDVVITSDPVDSDDITFMELFQYEARILMAHNHRLSEKQTILPEDMADETLITYPVEPERLDVYRHFMQPAGVQLGEQRTSELTDMIIQHVDSQRGVAVLPDWILQNHKLARTLCSRPLGETGLYRTVYAAVRKPDSEHIQLKDFIEIAPSVIRNLKQ